MDKDDGRLLKRRSVDEASRRENTNDSPTTSNQQQPKPVQADKVYEGIRGHERHILFHFFTLFSISFIVGVVFIHLSLWMNPSISEVGQKLEQSNIETSKEVDNEHIDTNDVPLWNALKVSFQYTGTYFQDTKMNISKMISDAF